MSNTHHIQAGRTTAGTITKYVVYANASSSLKLIYGYGNWLCIASKLFRRLFNMFFSLDYFSVVHIWNVICSLFFGTGEEVTDLKRQAVEEMMDRIKKGVHLRPVNQSSRPKTKVWNK